jgi:hypothetical protein
MPGMPTGQEGGKKRGSRSSGRKSARKDMRTKAELYECAKKKAIEGRSAMNKAQLKRALAK